MSEDPTTRKSRVLVLYLVDELKRLIRDVLRAEGYEVTATPSAAEALRILSDRDPAWVVIVDNFLVSAAAERLLAELRTRPDLRGHIRIIGLSAIDPGSLRGNAEWRVLDQHISLPFDLDDLIESVAGLSAQLQGAG